MSRSCYIFLLCSALLSLSALAVPAQSGPAKWGRVTPEEVQLKTCPYDSSASAVVLSDNGRIVFGYGVLHVERHKRIKILNREGLEEANVSIPYYAEDNFEKVVGLKAQAISVDIKGKSVVHALSSSQIYTVEHPDNWKEKRFTFPNVEVGTILEYKYTTLSRNFYTLESWCFQSHIPMLHSELTTERPTGLNYRILLQGKQLSAKYVNSNDTKWSLDNLPGLKKEQHVTYPLDYAERITFQLEIYTKSNGLPVNIENHALFLERKDHAGKVLDGVLTGDETETEKLRKIYNHVKNTFTWNGRYNILSGQPFKSLLETKRGNSAELNLYLALLLRQAGFNAHPALLSTRDHGKLYTGTSPLLFQFNHLIVCAGLQGKEILLDATHPLRPYTLLDKNDLNENAYVLEPEKQRWVKVQPALLTRQVISAEVNFSDLARPTHRFSVRYEGYEALTERQRYVDKGKFVPDREVINTPYADFKLTGCETKQFDNPEEPLLINLTYQPETEPDAQPDFIYLPPVLFSRFTENPFKDEKRYLPVELDYPSSYTYVLNLKIPPGYQLQEQPKAALLKIPGNLAEFRYQITQLNNSVQLSSSVIFKDPVIPVENYQHLREFYDQVIAKYREMIVLKKQ